jgi:murein DD-endopeptidase MepM/ murein hydrolase activator NlpD
MTAKFMMPYPDKQLTGHFGKIRTINGKKTNPHRGTDWAAKRGTPIPAVSNGTVKLVQFSEVLGWVLVQSVMGADKKVMYVALLKVRPYQNNFQVNNFPSENES